MRADDVARVIAAEAVSGTPEERWQDMLSIASVIANRSQQLGVPMEDVVSHQGEFNAYGNRMPPGTSRLVEMAQEAIDYVNQHGPINSATYYATETAVPNLPDGLNYEGQTTGHQYFSDPGNRAIRTAVGTIQPNQYAYASNLESVPTPNSASDVPTGLLGAPVEDLEPASGAMPGHWGLNPDVAPVPYPTMNPWEDMAAAAPVQAPTQELLAEPADLGNFPNAMMAQRDLAAPTSLGSDFGSASTSTGAPPVDFDASRFDGLGVSVAPGFDPGRFGDAVSAFDQSRFGPSSINPATNTTSFMGQPSSPAQLGSFPDAYAAQRGPTTGLLSAEPQARQGYAELAMQKALQDQQLNSFPSLTAYAEDTQPNVTSMPAQMTSTMTPAQIGAYQQFASSAAAGGITNLSGNTLVGPAGTATSNYTPALPGLDTVEVADQPKIGSYVEGPATQSALDQQEEQQSVSSAAAPSGMSMAGTSGSGRMQSTLGQRLSRALNPGTLAGGLLGGLALGPAGGLIGGLLGNGFYQNGGITGLLGDGLGSGLAPLGAQIPGGMTNISAIYGGQYEPGTFAVASNGAQIGAQPGGWTSYTNKYGVTNMISPTGQQSAYFGSSLSPGAHSDEEGGGGLLGGLF